MFVTLLEAALLYWRLGFSVLPIGRNKKPAVRWKKYQLEPATEAEVRYWFTRLRNLTGVGIIFGPVSGGLTCRDFDTVAAYEAWAARFPDLARTLPTVRTSRGYHVYFVSNHRRIDKFDDGELRGAGYCVAPPSVHPDGSVYTWVVPLPDGALACIEPADFGLAEPPTASEAQAMPADQEGATEKTEKTETTEKNGSDFSAHSVISVISVDPTGRFSPAIEAAITATVPRVPGARNAALFELARHLKNIPELSTVQPIQLRPIAYEWFSRALPVVTTKSFDVTWCDFLHAYDQAQFAIGHNPLRGIKEAALLMPDEFVERFDCPKTLLLIKVCKLLQLNMGGRAFFISTREAARILEVDPRSAWKRLKMLEREGLLRMEKEGSEYRATRYRYLGGK